MALKMWSGKNIVQNQKLGRSLGRKLGRKKWLIFKKSGEFFKNWVGKCVYL